MEKKYWEKSSGFVKAKCDVCGVENDFIKYPKGKLFRKRFLNLATDGSHSDDVCLITLCDECYKKILG